MLVREAIITAVLVGIRGHTVSPTYVLGLLQRTERKVP